MKKLSIFVVLVCIATFAVAQDGGIPILPKPGPLPEPPDLMLADGEDGIPILPKPGPLPEPPDLVLA